LSHQWHNGRSGLITVRMYEIYHKLYQYNAASPPKRPEKVAGHACLLSSAAASPSGVHHLCWIFRSFAGSVAGRKRAFCSGLDLVHGPRSCASACTNARRLARRWTAREQTSQNDALYTCGIIKRDICRVHGSPRAATSRISKTRILHTRGFARHYNV
jgi:hypothetical protein